MSYVLSILLLLLALPAWSSCLENAAAAIERDFAALSAAESKYQKALDEYQKISQETQVHGRTPDIDHSKHHEWFEAKSRRKTPLPADAEVDLENVRRNLVSVVDEQGAARFFWWSEECGCWYRYSGTQQGETLRLHWNGMSKPENKAFRFNGPDNKAYRPDQLPWNPTQQFLNRDELPGVLKQLRTLPGEMAASKQTLEELLKKLDLATR
ncbi:MAG: hypothetical protein A2X86_02860 [Bdellovibrionales bacterium GWA2_49_15]|nr:MAG: hypothetical protein A2X86_02860 [Bdellovibrionales bacterium GWA2_49_15]HAZ14120.1 hypothetical protein [Bdellovibrionales bacterium]